MRNPGVPFHCKAMKYPKIFHFITLKRGLRQTGTEAKGGPDEYTSIQPAILFRSSNSNDGSAA